MARDRGSDGTTRARAGADEAASPADAGDPLDLLEVRVVALGANEGRGWLALGRIVDGTSVTFVTDAGAAERIADAMAAGDEPVVVIERRQLV